MTGSSRRTLGTSSRCSRSRRRTRCRAWPWTSRWRGRAAACCRSRRSTRRARSRTRSPARRIRSPATQQLPMDAFVSSSLTPPTRSPHSSNRQLVADRQRGADMPATTRTTTPALSLTGVSKSYGAVHALSDVSLEVLPGRVHALLGENGAGKSTLMGVASGSVQPDRGVITAARGEVPAPDHRPGHPDGHRDRAPAPGRAAGHDGGGEHPRGGAGRTDADGRKHPGVDGRACCARSAPPCGCRIGWTRSAWRRSSCWRWPRRSRWSRRC